MGWIKERIDAEYRKHAPRLDWAKIAEKKIISEIKERFEKTVPVQVYSRDEIIRRVEE